MSEKLTAKLSDGTEHEFEWQEDDYYLKKYGARAAHLKPLKQEPPKELWINICGEAIGYGWRTKEEAETVAQPDCKTVRYTLPSEPEQKKPSPPKEVYVDVYASNKVSAAYVADELPSVDSDIRTRLVRYTLAPEPETTRERLTKISGVRDLSPFAALDKSLCATVEIDKDAIASSLKKPAREWWEVRYRDDTNAVNSFSSKERAEGFMAHFGSALDSYEIVHVREVV